MTRVFKISKQEHPKAKGRNDYQGRMERLDKEGRQTNVRKRVRVQNLQISIICSERVFSLKVYNRPSILRFSNKLNAAPTSSTQNNPSITSICSKSRLTPPPSASTATVTTRPPWHHLPPPQASSSRGHWLAHPSLRCRAMLL